MKRIKLLFITPLLMVGVIGTGYAAWVFNTDIAKNVAIGIGIDTAYSAGKLELAASPTFVNSPNVKWDTSGSSIGKTAGIILTEDMTSANTYVVYKVKHTMDASTHTQPYNFYKYTCTPTFNYAGLGNYITMTLTATAPWNTGVKAPILSTAVTCTINFSWKAGMCPDTRAEWDALYSIVRASNGRNPLIKVNFKAVGEN